MGYEQFVKEQGKPKPRKKKAKKPQDIDTQAITNELKVVLSSSNSASAPLSSNDLAAMQAYNRRLRTRLMPYGKSQRPREIYTQQYNLD